MKKNNIEEILKRAREEGEVFLGRLTADELRRSGFSPLWGSEKEFFQSFEFADIYILYDGRKYKFKYVFDGESRYYFYESEEELGKYFFEILKNYLR